MSVLDKLKLADGGKRAAGYDPVRVRRRKLADGLQHQIGLLQATLNGVAYRRSIIKRRRDLESDELYDVEQQRRVTPWWWVDDDGGVRFALRYGSAKLPIKDGKEVVVLPDLTALGKLLPALRQEVLSGGLDGALSSAAADLQARFKRGASAGSSKK